MKYPLHGRLTGCVLLGLKVVVVVGGGGGISPLNPR